MSPVAERAFTPEQQAAIDDRTGAMLLAANAGSGKTTVLVERLVAALLEDGVAPGRLLAITFTDKAAGELRSRVRARLAALGARAAAREVERAQISTIHAFCAQLLRTHAISAGLDPGFSVLSAAAVRAGREGAFERALADLLEDIDGVPRTAALDLVAAWGPDRLRDAIAGAYDTLRSLGETAPRLPPARPRWELGPALASLVGASDELAGELDAARRGPASLDAAREVVATARTLLAAGEPTRAQLGGLRLRRSVPELRTPACEAWSLAVDRLGQALHDREAVGDHALLDELLASFGRHDAAAKRARSGLDYEDLQLLTRDLLAGTPAVAEAYAERFERIMVDEFQDTNRLQLELLGHLDRGNVFVVGDELQAIYGFRHADVAGFRAERAAHEAQGRVRVLAANWRSAPELLATINGAWGADVHPRYEPLVAGRPEADAGGPRTELLLTADSWDAPDLDPELSGALARGMPGGSRPSKLAEARAVAHRVRALVDAGACEPSEVAVLVRAAGDLHVFERALEREGFATLAGGGRGYWLRQPVQDLTSYLAALVNPRDEQALYGVLASPLCGLSSDGLAHVAAVARAHRGVAWRALRSVALAERLSAADAEHLEAFLVRFCVERTAAPRFALDELLERAVVHAGYDLHVLRLPGGRRRLANVHKLLRLAAAFEEEHGRDVRGFIDHATAEVEADAREAEAPVDLGGEPAIRLMTIHAAKGLEFGVVVVADLGRRSRPASADLLVDRTRVGLRVLRLGEKGAGALAHAELLQEAGAAAAAEERRIFHVAFTRAEERLILSGVVPLGDTWPAGSTTACPLSWIGPRLGEDLLPRLIAEPELELDEPRPGGRVHVGARLVTPATAPVTLGLAAPVPGAQIGLFPTAPTGSIERSGSDVEHQSARVSAGAAGLTGALTDPAAGLDAPPAWSGGRSPVSPPPVATLSYTALAAYARCGYRFYLERVLALPPTEPPPAARALAVEQPGLDPRVRGSIAHLALERLDLRHPQLPTTEELQAMGSRFDAEPTRAEAEELSALLAGFLAASPLLARLGVATRVRVEAPFVLPLPDPAAPLLNGVLDVLADEPGGDVLVVDWKTDRLGERAPEAVVAASYATQQALYALAVLHTGAPAVEVAYAFLERPAVVVAARFTRAELPELTARVLARAEPLLARRFAVSTDPHLALCAGCPGRGGLCVHPPAVTDRVGG